MCGKMSPKLRNDNIEIAGKPLKKFQRTFVIAELASSHEGNKDIAVNLLKAASEAGADAVKFQIFSANELLTPDCLKYESFLEIEMTQTEWKEIFAECKEINIPFIAEVFDEGSFHFIDQYDVAAYKIHSTDLTNQILLEKVALSGKPVFLSCGGSTFEEIRFAVDLIESKSNYNIILMHGFQAFPTKLEDTFLTDIIRFEKEFLYPVGYADHCDADTEDAITLPMVAVGMGACIIEKHITLNRSLRGRDYYSALNPDEFADMVSLIQNVDTSMGGQHAGFTQAEKTYRKLMKKSIVASRNIKQGEKISLSHLAFKRTPEPGLQPMTYTDFIGRNAGRDIEANTLIKKEDMEGL